MVPHRAARTGPCGVWGADGGRANLPGPCGCGKRMWISTHASERYGFVKGTPVRYVQGYGVPPEPQTYGVDPDTDCWLWQGAMFSGRLVLRVGGSVVAWVDRRFYGERHGRLAPGDPVPPPMRRTATSPLRRARRHGTPRGRPVGSEWLDLQSGDGH